MFTLIAVGFKAMAEKGIGWEGGDFERDIRAYSTEKILQTGIKLTKGLL